MDRQYDDPGEDYSFHNLGSERRDTGEGTGNHALDALLRARGETASSQPSAPQPPKQEEDVPVQPMNTYAGAVPQQDAPQADFAERPRKKAHGTSKKTASRKLSASKASQHQAPSGRRRKKKKKSRAGRKVAAVLAVLVVLLAGSACAYTYGYSGIHYGMKAGALKVGGMSLESAQKIIDKAGPDMLDGEAITLSIYNTEYTVDIASVTTGLDSEKSAQEAYNYTHTGNILTRLGHTLGALAGQGEAPLSVSVDEDALAERLDEISEEALTQPVQPSWKAEDNKLIIDTGKPGVDFDRDAVSEEVTEKIRTMNFKPIKVKVTTSDQNPVDMDKISEEAQTAAQNATVDKSDGKTIIPSVDGVQFDLDAAKEIVGDGSQQTYEIPITRTPAEITADDLRKVLFTDTLASTSTSLNAGNKSRTNNVHLACSYINGTILNPGDTFSYNETVGERTADRGFQSAGAYANGELIDEVGGGVCQPSSTLYMAVLRADLKVVERHNHSLTVAYTPLGEDATVSWGGPDFRFKNDTKYPIKILASQSGSAMYVKLIGTKTSDKTVSLNTEVLEKLEYQTVEKNDSSLPAGQREVKQSGATGYKTATYKTVTENGKSTKVKANNSYYKKRDKVILVGTGGSSSNG